MSSIIEILLCNQNGESFKLGDVGCFVRGLTYANEDVTEDKAATTVIRANNLNYGKKIATDYEYLRLHFYYIGFVNYTILFYSCGTRKKDYF